MIRGNRKSGNPAPGGGRLQLPGRRGRQSPPIAAPIAWRSVAAGARAAAGGLDCGYAGETGRPDTGFFGGECRRRSMRPDPPALHRADAPAYRRNAGIASARRRTDWRGDAFPPGVSYGAGFPPIRRRWHSALVAWPIGITWPPERFTTLPNSGFLLLSGECNRTL